MARAIRTGEEQDALTRSRRYFKWRPGEIRAVKRRANRRDRRDGKQEARSAR